MKEITEITFLNILREDHQAISIEQVIKRKVMRRRRVAKRMLKRSPLFAVQEMQAEFPGYTYDQFIEDVTRKTRKGKSFRRPKPKGFDWKMIREHIPEFFNKCIERTKTKAVLRGRLKDGTDFTCIVRSVWIGEYGENRLRTGELIKLWQGPLKAFLSHSAMQLFEHHNEIKEDAT
jgi:hypothetical protein